MTLLAVPPERLTKDTLQALMEEFVTRDGTDYGDEELSLEQRVANLQILLGKGEAIIAFDTSEESFNILNRDEWLSCQ